MKSLRRLFLLLKFPSTGFPEKLLEKYLIRIIWIRKLYTVSEGQIFDMVSEAQTGGSYEFRLELFDSVHKEWNPEMTINNNVNK